MGNPFIEGFRASREDKRLDRASDLADRRNMQLQQQVDILQNQNDRQQKVADDLDTNETLFDLETTGNWDGFAHVANRIPGLTNGRLTINPISPNEMFEASDIDLPTLDLRNSVTRDSEGNVYVNNQKVSPDFLKQTGKLIDYDSYDTNTSSIDEESGDTTIQYPLLKRLASLRKVSDTVFDADGNERVMQTYASPASAIMGIGPISGYQDFRSDKMATIAQQTKGKSGSGKSDELIQLAHMNNVVNSGGDLTKTINPQTGELYGDSANEVYEILATKNNMDKKYSQNRLGDFGGDTKSPSMVEKVTTATKKDVPLLGTPEYKRYVAQLITDENVSGNKYSDSDLKIRPATAGLGSLATTLDMIKNSDWNNDLFKPNTVTTNEPLLDDDGAQIYREENVLKDGNKFIDAVTGTWATKLMPQYRKVSEAQAFSEGITKDMLLDEDMELKQLDPQRSAQVFKQLALNANLSANMRQILNALSGASVSDNERVDFFNSMLGGDPSRINKDTIVSSLTGVVNANKTGVEQNINQISDYTNPGTKADLTLKLQEALASKSTQPETGITVKGLEQKVEDEKQIELDKGKRTLNMPTSMNLFDIPDNYLEDYGTPSIADASGGTGTLTQEEIFSKFEENKPLLMKVDDATNSAVDFLTNDNLVESFSDYLVDEDGNINKAVSNSELVDPTAVAKYRADAGIAEDVELTTKQEVELVLQGKLHDAGITEFAKDAGLSVGEVIAYMGANPDKISTMTPNSVNSDMSTVRSSADTKAKAGALVTEALGMYAFGRLAPVSIGAIAGLASRPALYLKDEFKKGFKRGTGSRKTDADKLSDTQALIEKRNTAKNELTAQGRQLTEQLTEAEQKLLHLKPKADGTRYKLGEMFGEGSNLLKKKELAYEIEQLQKVSKLSKAQTRQLKLLQSLLKGM